MLKFFQRFSSGKVKSGCFHPDSPVVSEVPVNFKQVSVFRREYFPQQGPIPWLDREDAEYLVEKLLADNQLTPEEAKLCRKWIVDGYVILENFFTADYLDEVWLDYENAIATSLIKPEPNCEVNGLPGRNLNTHFQVSKIEDLLRHQKVTRVISLLLGVKCLPFQTITGHNGSQQLEHSDAIHMTTYPMDYLAATWTAFEDIHPDSGPLVYYPGSHRLPHFLTQEANIHIGAYQDPNDNSYHEKYEPGIQKIIQENNLEPKYFIAKKGDVLIWHSNLIHGGSKRKNFNLSRKAVVCHYFAEGCLCYHDLSGNIAHIHLN